jgi:cytochrome P450
MNGTKHKRDRRLMMPAFSKTAVAGYLEQTVHTTTRVLDRWRAGDAVDLKQRSTELALTVAMQCLYGVDLLDEADELGELAVGFLNGMLSVGALLLPMRIPGTPYARFLTTAERLEKRLTRLIAERRSNAAGKRDVLSLMVAARDDDGASFSDRDLLGHAAVLFVAAHETTANTLAWTLLLLATHPEVRASLEDELHAVLRGAPPTTDDLDRMPLLDAVVRESMRLLPASAIMFFRRASGSFQLNGVDMPPKSTILLSSLVTQRDERVFPDALAFDPSRWSRSKPSIYEYLPFGAGPRMCIGAPFAAQALRVMLVMQLQRFRCELPSSLRVDRQVRGITLGVRGRLDAKLSARTDRSPPTPTISGDIHELVRLPRAR